MCWLRKYLVWILGHYNLKYSPGNFFDRGTISNLGTLFYASQRFELFYRVGPSAISYLGYQILFCLSYSTSRVQRKNIRKICLVMFKISVTYFYLWNTGLVTALYTPQPHPTWKSFGSFSTPFVHLGNSHLTSLWILTRWISSSPRGTASRVSLVSVCPALTPMEDLY